MYAAWKPSRKGEPWEPWEDNNIIEDFHHGCTLFTMAMRARRDEMEVEARLAQLGFSMDKQPKPRRK